MLFNRRTIITKRNHRYYGPTESYKMATSLDEASVDLQNVYGQFNSQQTEFDALASGYMVASGRLSVMTGFASDLEDTLNKMIYIQATQDEIF